MIKVRYATKKWDDLKENQKRLLLLAVIKCSKIGFWLFAGKDVQKQVGDMLFDRNNTYSYLKLLFYSCRCCLYLLNGS